MGTRRNQSFSQSDYDSRRRYRILTDQGGKRKLFFQVRIGVFCPQMYTFQMFRGKVCLAIYCGQPRLCFGNKLIQAKDLDEASNQSDSDTDVAMHVESVDRLLLCLQGYKRRDSLLSYSIIYSNFLNTGNYDQSQFILTDPHGFCKV